MNHRPDNPDRDRLEDLAIEEALGRNPPPDLRARILAAARGDDAPTPRRGEPSVPARGRTARQTRGLSRKHWKGAPFVVTALALAAAVLAVFFALKPPVELPANAGVTAERAKPTPAAGAKERPGGEQRPPAIQPQANTPATNQAAPGPDRPEPAPEPGPEPAPKPPDEVEGPVPDQPEPAPKPEPKVEPRPEPGPVVDEPGPEPKPEGTGAKPEQPRAVVASMELGAAGGKRVWSSRLSDSDEWKPVQNLNELRGVRRVPDTMLVEVFDGTQLKGAGGELTLANGALLRCDGVISLHADGDSVRVELVSDDIYLDNLGCDHAVRVTRGALTAGVGAGAAIFAAGRGKLDITCLDGEISAGGKTLPAGRRATLNDRGLGREFELTARDLSHPLVGGLKPRVLSEEDFDDLPARGLIRGELARLEEDGKTVTVARDSGRNAHVSLEFDEITTLLPGQMVRLRYRHTGAEKLIVQFWNPDRKDNFGIDLPPGRPGQWHEVELRIERLLDRATAASAAKAGDRWQSGGVYTTGSATTIEVDWVEFVRLPEYGK
ncbi:MAG: hypothetical protein HS108_06265 [Planctomycetes bacterium]|jgi:hypothetical protein|nr:hypothetical protein [Planctomycetota bacterium]MCL4730961.1 hypothetical protein [Planctomycetota bacterium]